MASGRWTAPRFAIIAASAIPTGSASGVWWMTKRQTCPQCGGDPADRGYPTAPNMAVCDDEQCPVFSWFVEVPEVGDD